jgi:hypothetical protein
MIRKIRLNEKPTTLKIVIETNGEQRIWLKVKDANRKNTFYTKRFSDINGRQSFFVRLPQAPEVAKVIVYNDKTGRGRRDFGFRVLSITEVPLKTTPIKMSKKTKSFVKFAQEFCDECGYLSSSPTGHTYRSNNGKFRIDLFDKIRSKKSKKVIGTPARISQLTGKIEVSKAMFKRYTIAMRMAILLHEYSHFYLNRVPSDESEADINGLKIYLSLGYPRIDAYNVFLNVFKKSASEQNLHRYEKLDSFIRNFEEKYG